MRLSITTLGILCLSIISSVSAQTGSKIVWGEAFEAGRIRNVFSFVSDDEQGYYFIRKTGNINDNGILVKLDGNLNMQNESALTPSNENGRGHSSWGLSLTGSQPSVIWHSYQDKTAKLEGQDFDKTTLALEGGLTDMTELFTEYIGIMKKYVDYGELISSKSKDGSKRVFTYSGKGYSADNAAFGICVTGDNNEMLYSAQYNAGSITSDVNRMAVAVGNDGSAYALARIVSGGKKDMNSELKIWKFGPDGSNEGELSIPVTDKSISKIGMAVGDDGTLVCAGYYSYDGGLSTAQGTIVIRIDSEDMSITNKKFEDFPTSLIEQSSGSKRLNGYKRSKLQGPIILENGNVVIGIEQNEGSMEPLVYRDILVLEFGKNGEPIKTGIIRKEQNGSWEYHDYLSYKLVAKGNKTYVIYIDKAKNTEIKGNEKHAKCIITGFFPAILAELTADGFVKEEICDNKSVKMRVAIEDIQQTQEGNLIFMRNQISGGNSSMQWGKLEL